MKNFRLYAIILLALVAHAAFAGPVTREKAMHTAQEFFNERGMARKANLTVVDMPSDCRDDNGQTGFYVLNHGTDGGFVIVSADDRTMPILGYADKGHVDPRCMPDNMRAWLRGYAEQMRRLDYGEVAVKPGKLMAKPTTKAIQPLLKSHWTQNSPYNTYTPSYTVVTNDGNSISHAPVGCVATAMAQVMYYHQYPDATKAKIPGYTNANQVFHDNVIKDVEASTPIDWDNMLDIYYGNETDEQKKAVANLSLYCATAVNMKFNKNSSSAYLYNVAKALKNYFGYDGNLKWENRLCYGTSEWNELIYTELSEGRPVVYGGQSGGGGHAFVVDGYDGSELYHVNWGWNMCDGYFMLSILNPDNNLGTGASTTSDGYNMDQEAIIGVKPPKDGEQTETRPVQASWFLKSATDGVVTYACQNLDFDPHTFTCGLAYFDNEGNLQMASSNVYNTPSLNMYDYSTLNFTVDLIKTPGTYTLFAVGKADAQTEWIPAEHSVEYVTCVVTTDGTVTLTAHPVIDVEVSISFPELPRIANARQPVSVTILNRGEDYNRTIYLFASQTDTKGDSKAKFGAVLIHGEQMTAEPAFTPNAAGT